MNNPINRDQAKQPQSDRTNAQRVSWACVPSAEAAEAVMLQSVCWLPVPGPEGARRVYIGVQEFEGLGFKSFKKFQEV